MSFGGLLRHVVTIERRTGSEDDVDSYGHPLETVDQRGTWRCRIEPREAREVPIPSEAGAVIGTHTIFGAPVDLRAGDRLVPVPDDGRVFEVLTIDDAGGAGRHLEVQARLVTSSALPEPS